MGTISAELTTFKDALDGKTGSISSVCSDINSKLSSVMAACNTASSSVSQNYQGDGVVAATSSISSIISTCSKITSSINSTVNSAISEADSIISDVKKLEDINKEIEETKSTLNGIPNTDENKSRRNSLQSTIDSKESDFTKLHEEAMNKLTALKAKTDDSLVVKQSQAEASLAEAEAQLPAGSTKVDEIVVTGGTLNKYQYKASNGKNVSYYIYVPTTTTDTKLPVSIYFHGMKETADKYPDRGPYGLIKSGKMTPKGIVIFPQADNGTKDSDFHRADYEAAVMELTYKVCEKYNGDVKRLSVSGHSNGACAVGHIVANYPGVFAAAAPISGTTSGSEGMNKTNLWSFRGSYDSATVDRTAKNIISKGGKNAHYTVWPRQGHAVQAYTFEQTLTDENGNQTTLMDWLMSKTTA